MLTALILAFPSATMSASSCKLSDKAGGKAGIKPPKFFKTKILSHLSPRLLCAGIGEVRASALLRPIRARPH